MAQKRYFWLKLQDTFFSQKEIKKLRKIAGGDTYTIIYLKLQLISLRNGGKIYYEGLEETFYEEMALELDEDSENVKFTILFLEKYNLIQMINDNEYLMTNVEKSTGSETQGAVRTRRYREKQKALQCNTNVQNCNVEKEIEKEIDKEIEKEKIREDSQSSIVLSEKNEKVYKHFESCGFIPTVKLLEKISADIEVYGAKNLMDAATEAMERGKINNYKYLLGIVQNWQTEGRDAKSKKFEPNPKTIGFNNFEPREYYNDPKKMQDLENKLLGWDKEDDADEKKT